MDAFEASLWMKPIFFGSGNVFPGPPFDYEVDSENLVLLQLAAELYICQI